MIVVLGLSGAMRRSGFLVIAFFVVLSPHSSGNVVSMEDSSTELHAMELHDDAGHDVDVQREMWQDALERRATLQDDMEGEPLQLIKPVAGHDRLEVNEIVLERLAAINEPLTLVAVVGPYHSGKSFLLNVLLNSSRGFPVGAKPDPETRGVWIRILPKESLTGADGSQVVLLDTEGFYGEGASRIYDARIFAVATLLSSHLVYNTLRTLGDAQSVSALADLSKQAQVFNLQNWLHTAHATTDNSASLDVDPFLLLETLKFPPLTWVVQGFDLDLEASSSPVNYLQKFLAAHSQTGDRTLDTLFNQGINCYTLRTPIDFNALRQRVGGQGLAADLELYENLHPNYRSDLQALRKGVFENLKSKGDGNFTGKNLARLIPLLVHYVNEDFPLNADRKLRDVLADIIVDGSFSGGVQYFQLAMEAFSKTATATQKPKGNVLNKQESDAILSALAASALASEELERVLNSAERKAIDYCRKRCVGVPQSLVEATCEAQLGVKIARMKPHYREENERKVKDVLVLLGEGLRASAVKEIEEIELPTREADLQRQCARTIQNASRRYDTLVGPHRGSHLYTDAKNQMQEDIQIKCDRILRLNVEKITGILNNGKDAYRKAYEEAIQVGGFVKDTQGTRHKPLSTKKLADINLAAVKSAQGAFANSVKAGTLSWIGPGYELYDFHSFQCLQWSKQRYSEIQTQNDIHVKSFCDELAAELGKRYKDEMNRFSPFPDNDETITEKADSLGKQLIQEYMSMVKDFSSVSIVEERRKELSYTIDQARSYLLKKNTALMTAFCYDPLMDAYKELRMQDCERSSRNMWVSWSFWSAKCLWPGPRYMFGFKYAAYAVAKKHLDMAQAQDVAKGVVLTPATRNKVIQAWIEHDLAPHANVVLVNFAIISACVVGAMGCTYFLLRLSVQRSGGAFKGLNGAQWPSYYDSTPSRSPPVNSFQAKTSPGLHYRRL